MIYKMYEINDDWLVFCDQFNEPLSNVVFPVGIQKIIFGWDFNQDINNLLPNSLTHLIFSFCFNQDVSQLPKSLIYLKIYKYRCDFKQSLNPYLYHLTEFAITGEHKHKVIMEDRCKINQHNTTIRSDTLIDLLLKN